MRHQTECANTKNGRRAMYNISARSKRAMIQSREYDTAIFDEARAKERKALDERALQESGAVKTMLDLSSFMIFDATNRRVGDIGHVITVYKSGHVTLSPMIVTTSGYKEGEKMEFLLNKVGTTIVARKSKKGIPTRVASNSGGALRAHCVPLVNALKQLNVKLPARYVAEWDEVHEAWVGRKPKGA